MKNLTLHKSSKNTSIFVLLVILLLGIPLTLYQAQIQQIIKQFAWQTNQTASALCSPNSQKIVISVQFTNREDSRSINVVARDIQTGKTVDMGVVKSGETKTSEIVTDNRAVRAGSVIFTLTSVEGTPSTDSFTANYQAIGACSQSETPPQACPAGVTSDQGFCRWDQQNNAVEYKVVVKEVESGYVVKEETVKQPYTQSAFTMQPDKTYTCSVNAVNACGVGAQSVSPEKKCAVPTPTPFCPADPQKESSCVWDPLNGATEYKVDILEAESGKNIKSETVKHPNNRLVYPTEPGVTYFCRVTPVNYCAKEGTPVDSEPKTCTVPTGTPAPTIPVPTEAPTPTDTPLPTETPVPTETPTPPPPPTETPVPTPTSIPTPTVKIVQQPPRVVQQPPRVVQQPGQTVVQRGGVRVVQQPGQTVVQQAPPVVVEATPRPTVVPTGDNTLPVIAGGVTLIAAMIGALLFFAL